MKVCQKLLDSGVAKPIPVEDGLYDCNQELISAGLFAVPHKEHSDRIICDRRPSNEFERRIQWAALRHGSLLTQLLLQPEQTSETVRGSGDDLAIYFYFLKHTPSWCPRNTITPQWLAGTSSDMGVLPHGNFVSHDRLLYGRL